MSILIPRRTLFGIGAGTLALIPLIGCKNEGAEQQAGQQTQGQQPTADKAATNKADDEKHDAELLNQGVLLEQGAINVYTAAAGLAFIAEDKAVLPVAKLFMSQHEEHRDTLAKWVQQLGGTPADPKTAKTPEIPAIITDESAPIEERKKAVLEFARKLEKEAATAYFQFVTQALHTDLARRLAADILPVEAQHVAIYDLVLGKEAPVSAALFSEQG